MAQFLAVVVVSLSPATALGALGQSSDDIQVTAAQDLTYQFDCSIERQELDETGTIVLSSWTEACPPGTNVTTFITTESEAIRLGLAYAPLTGNPASDATTAEELTSYYRPSGSPEAMDGSLRTQACAYRRYSASGSYTINSKGGRAYFSVDYAQDESCIGWIHSVTQSYSGTVYWIQTYYPYPVNGDTVYLPTSCSSFGNVTKSFTSNNGSYGWQVNLGGYLSINTYDTGCTFWANSYTDSVLL
jgi:hypothetical protein